MCKIYVWLKTNKKKKFEKKWIKNTKLKPRKYGKTSRTNHDTNTHTPVQFDHRKWHDIESKFDYENTKLIVLINYFSARRV